MSYNRKSEDRKKKKNVHVGDKPRTVTPYKRSKEKVKFV